MPAPLTFLLLPDVPLTPSPDAGMCAVYCDSVTAGGTVFFELESPGGAAIKNAAGEIITNRKRMAPTRLDKTAPIISLPRTDQMTPTGCVWRIQLAEAGILGIAVALPSASFDLASLIV